MDHGTQCPYCIRRHTKATLRHGASHEELMKGAWVASEMRVGAAYAHSLLAIEEMKNRDSEECVSGRLAWRVDERTVPD